MQLARHLQRICLPAPQEATPLPSGPDGASANSGSVQLLVSLPHGPTLCLQLPRVTTVAALKELIQQRAGIPSAEQRLLHNGKTIDEHISLAAQGIRNNDEVHLQLRLRGGQPLAGVMHMGIPFLLPSASTSNSLVPAAPAPPKQMRVYQAGGLKFIRYSKPYLKEQSSPSPTTEPSPPEELSSPSPTMEAGASAVEPKPVAQLSLLSRCCKLVFCA